MKKDIYELYLYDPKSNKIYRVSDEEVLGFCIAIPWSKIRKKLFINIGRILNGCRDMRGQSCVTHI